MKALLVNKGVKPDRVRVIYNWGYGDEKVTIPFEENEFAKANALSPDVFYAVYAGNIGRMQNVELVVKAAEKLQAREDIRFLIIGDGVNRDTIAEMAATLPNVKQLHLLPYHRLGQDKYAGLGREYTLSHITPPTGEEMERLAAAARAAAPTLHVQIGG